MTRLWEHRAPESIFDFSVSAATASNLPTLRRSSRILKKATTSRITTDHSRRRQDNEDQWTSSALISHAQEAGHHINWSDFKVVCQDNNPCRLLIKESLLTQPFQPELNRTTHSVPMIVFSDGLPRQMLPDPNGYNPSFSHLCLSRFVLSLSFPHHSLVVQTYLLHNDNFDHRNVEFLLLINSVNNYVVQGRCRLFIYSEIIPLYTLRHFSINREISNALS